MDAFGWPEFVHTQGLGSTKEPPDRLVFN